MTRQSQADKIAALDRLELFALLDQCAVKFDVITDQEIWEAQASVRAAPPSLHADASPEAFGAAMALCQMYAPACSDAGGCQMDGWCFGRDGTAFRTVHAAVQKEIDRSWRPTYERAWWRVALEALTHHQWIGSRAINALQAVAINRRVRAEYAAESEKARPRNAPCQAKP